MEFRKFPSLENTYKKDIIERVKTNPLFDSAHWVITEKLDGSNFSFHCNGEEIKVASRNQFTDGSFHGCQEVIGRYSDDVLDLFFQLQRWMQCENIIVYGELYGNGIQKRVSYGDKDFRAFDIYVDGEPLDFYTVQSLVAGCENLQLVPLLGYAGTLDEALEYNETFRSFLTPNTHDGDNWAEGVVILPSEPMFFGNGSRVYLKQKSEKFSEKSGKKKVSQTARLSPEQQEQLNAVMEYVNKNRALSAASKIGTITNRDFGKLLGMSVQDAIEDYVGDGNEKPGSAVRKQVMKESASEVRSVFLELI